MTQPEPICFNTCKALEATLAFLFKAQRHSLEVSPDRMMAWLYLLERTSYQKYAEGVITDALYAAPKAQCYFKPGK